MTSLQPREARGLGRALFLVATLTSLTVAAAAGPALWTRWMARERVLTVAQAPARDVAIVFGAEVYPSGRPSPYLRARL
ncbi:MAG: hypothetical protein ACLGHZ_03425, partial [Actinomycetes bacterium]